MPNPLFTGVGAPTTAGRLEPEDVSSSPFISRLFWSLPFLSVFTGEEVLIHLSMFFPSGRAQHGSVLRVLLQHRWSPNAPPAVPLQPRSSQRDQEQPRCLGARVHTIKTLPHHVTEQGSKRQGLFIIFLKWKPKEVTRYY